MYTCIHKTRLNMPSWLDDEDAACFVHLSGDVSVKNGLEVFTSSHGNILSALHALRRSVATLFYFFVPSLGTIIYYHTFGEKSTFDLDVTRLNFYFWEKRLHFCNLFPLYCRIIRQSDIQSSLTCQSWPQAW